MKAKLCVALALLSAMLLLAPAAHAHFFVSRLLWRTGDQEPTPDLLLRRLLQVGRNVEFSGSQETVVYKPRKHNSRQLVEQKAGRHRIYYLFPPALRGKEVISDGSHTFSAGGGAAVPDIGLGNDLERLVKRSLGVQQVIGRRAYVIELRPEGRGGGSRRVWIDAEKWVPLRWEDRDAAGALVSATSFTSIQFSGVPEVAAPTRSIDPPPVQTSPREAPRLAGFRVAAPSYLPRGFERRAVTLSPIGHGRQATHRVTTVYSNGLGVITLVQAPAGAIRNAPRPGKVEVSAAGQLVWVRDGFHFVLDATPPLAPGELRRIAGSVR